MNPLVSIIIPIHNREEILHATLKSVLTQTYENWECIIIDDHSTDRSFELVKEWTEKDSRFKVYRLPDPKRFGNAARNYGLQLAKGEYINFLDSDDILDPRKIKLQMEEFLNSPELDMVACQHIFFNSSDHRILAKLKFSTPEYWKYAVWNTTEVGYLWSTLSPLWKKDFLKIIGFWNENLRAWQDVDLNIRALYYKGNIKRVEKILSYCAHEASESISALNPEIRNSFLIDGMFTSWKLIKDLNQISSDLQSLLMNRLLKINIFEKKFSKSLMSLQKHQQRFDLPKTFIFIGLFSFAFKKISLFQTKKIIDNLTGIQKILDTSFFCVSDFDRNFAQSYLDKIFNYPSIIEKK